MHDGKKFETASTRVLWLRDRESGKMEKGEQKKIKLSSNDLRRQISKSPFARAHIHA